MKHLKEYINESMSIYTGQDKQIYDWLKIHEDIFEDFFIVKGFIVPKTNDNCILSLKNIKEEIPSYIKFGDMPNATVIVDLSMWNNLTDEQKPKSVCTIDLSCDDIVMKSFNIIVYDMFNMHDGGNKLSKIEKTKIKFARKTNGAFKMISFFNIDLNELKNITIENLNTIAFYDCKFTDSLIDEIKNSWSNISNNEITKNLTDYLGNFAMDANWIVLSNKKNEKHTFIRNNKNRPFKYYKNL